MDALTGKTEKQVIEILFEDVKSVVEDKEITDKLWETWNSSADEPADEILEGVTVLDAATKTKLGSKEEDDFKIKIKGETFTNEPGNYKGQSYTIYKTNNSKDSELAVKIAGIHRGIRILVDKGFKLPADLNFYCTFSPPKAQAFKRNTNWNPMANIVLGKDITIKNNRPSISMQKIGEFNRKGIEDKTTLTVIHEIAHILHERYFGNDFWTLGTNTEEMQNYVSYYSEGSQKEFVAEVFTGVVAGKKFCSDVMDRYKKWGGPLLPATANTGKKCGEADSILKSTAPN